MNMHLNGQKLQCSSLSQVERHRNLHVQRQEPGKCQKETAKTNKTKTLKQIV